MPKLPSGVVTFLLTDIVESTAMWERHPTAMAAALERHDELIAEVVAAHGGTLLKSKLEGDATVSVFARATAGALAAVALRDALRAEPWPDGAAPTVRMALHTGEAFERAGDYFGPALNRAARLRGLAGAGQVLLSQAVAELVRDHLPEGVGLADRGHRELRGLSRGENVYELAPIDDLAGMVAAHSPFERPELPAPLSSAGPFVGRGDELARLTAAWERAAAGEPQAWFLAGEPGVGKSRLAAECARAAYEAGGVVLYGRCDEELGAPLQPFVEALRSLAPALGPARLREVRGIDELGRLVPELGELLPDAAPALRAADPDSERYALFDATTELLCAASAEVPTLLVLDDLHWAGKTTLSLLRHLLRNAKRARLLVLGTYRDTELGRTHPLASMLADLRREQAAEKLTLSGLEPNDVAAYLHAVGNDDRALGRELAEVTSGNPFFLIEALRHVEETGGRWEPGSLPEGVREATGRRLSQLSEAANNALSVAAVTGTSFDIALVEQVRGVDVLDEMTEAVQAGLVTEEPGAPGRFRFAHALVRQVLLAELVTLKRVRLHRSIAELLEAKPGDDPEAQLADLAYHWFECASTGAGDKAVDACRRAADRASERLAYEEAADLYGMAIQALDAADHMDEDARAHLHLARCDALLTAGDVAGARAAIDALGQAARGDDRLSAWHTTYAGQLAVLAEPDRLDEIVGSIGDAARAMHEVGDLQGEATARYVHALALERLGQIGAAQRALDEALAAARTADDRRLADAILAEVPPAALWGPSPVTRASGNCLDVVRVLRITAGAPAVESVALRCQAVLEALRGRMDAARRMIASAHRTVDQLGLTHRVLETEVSAGFIELLDGQAEAAEAHLRPAYEELRDRGLGGEAAQAAALLGRALLMQQRDEEAEQVATEAEKLAGSDLKAAIAWRDVRAEAAARRGETALALELAREAVELAAATDALLLVADARLALATVLRATGDVAGADAEAIRAVEACEAKGATVLADRARSRTTAAPPALASPTTDAQRGLDQAEAPVDDALFVNAAVRTDLLATAALNEGDVAAVEALLHPDARFEDRRGPFQVTTTAKEQLAGIASVTELRGHATYTLLATRGDRLSLSSRSWHGKGAEVTVLELCRVDADGRIAGALWFDPGDLDAAFAELDQLFFEEEASAAPDLWAAQIQVMDALRQRDDARHEAAYAPEFTATGKGLVPWGPVDAAGWTLFHSQLVALRPEVVTRMTHVLAIRPDRILTVATDFDGDDVEVSNVFVGEHGPDTRCLWLEAYGVRQLDEATRRYEQLGARAALEDRFVTTATRTAERFFVAVNAGEVDTALSCFTADFRLDDRRALLQARTEGSAHLRNIDYIVQGQGIIRWRTIATRGDHLALCDLVWESDSATISFLNLTRANDDGLADLGVWFDPDDVDDACSELDRLWDEERRDELVDPLALVPNRALRTVEALQEAYDQRDLDTYLALCRDDIVFEDRRFQIVGGREMFVDQYRHLAKGVGRIERELVATMGDNLCLCRTVLRDAAAAWEFECLIVSEVDDDGRLVSSVMLASDDRAGATKEVTYRYYARLGAPERVRALLPALDAHDPAAVLEALGECTFENHRVARFASFDDPDDLNVWFASMLAVTRGLTIEIVRLLAAEPNGTVTVSRWSGETEDGAPFDSSWISVSRWDDEGFTFVGVYELEDMDAALARFAELEAG